MVTTIAHKLQRIYEDYLLYEMSNELVEKYQKIAHQEKYEMVKSLMACKMKEGELVCNHVQRYVDHLVRLNVHFDEALAIDMVLNYLPCYYDQFMLAYHWNNTETTLA